MRRLLAGAALALSALPHHALAQESVAVSEQVEAAESDPDEAADPVLPEARLYDASIDVFAAVDAALVRAAERGKLVMIVLGANWCHDSRALAGWLETERIKALVAEKYELVYVNVGMPQTGDGHNLGIAARFGVEGIEGTPTMLILDGDGSLLNPDTAKSWRDAASRSEDEIYEELALAATTEIARD